MSMSTEKVKSLSVRGTCAEETDHGIVRLHGETMKEMRLFPGDTILIETDQSESVVQCWRNLSEEVDKDEVVLDKYTLENVDVDIDGTVNIKPISQDDVGKIDSMTLSLETDQDVDNVPSLVQRQLLNRPVMDGDVIPIPTNQTYLKNPSDTDQVIKASVKDVTHENDIGVIGDITKIEVE